MVMYQVSGSALAASTYMALLCSAHTTMKPKNMKATEEIQNSNCNSASFSDFQMRILE
jgi:hypothetical protein